jgi:hypothetical protein
VAWAAWITKENFGGVPTSDDEALGVSQGLFHVGSGIHETQSGDFWQDVRLLALSQSLG